VVASQKLPAAQCASTKQVPRQLSVPHTYGAHATGAGVVHRPAALQYATSTAEFVVRSQAAGAQSMVIAGYAHEVREVPSQEPPQVVPSVVQAGREPTGAPVAGEQIPARPVTLQASH
jgi:hypothetical protein